MENGLGSAFWFWDVSCSSTHLHPMPKNHLRLLPSSIAIISTERLTPAQPEGKRVALAVWPEEEHG